MLSLKLPCLLPVAYFRKVEPDWVQPRPLQNSQHLEPDLALHLSNICSKTWDKGHELQLMRELDLHQMDAGILYLVWSLLPERT